MFCFILHDIIETGNILKILILTAAPEHIAANQRFRFEHYIHLPDTRNHQFTLKPFYNRNTWGILHKPGYVLKKSWGILCGLIKRLLVLFVVPGYDFIYIHREAAPVGPPVFEWLISKVLRKKIIFDFDDAIWIKTASEANPMVAGIKCTWKIKYICKYSSIVTVGNDFLAAYAREYCADVRVIPTVVNTDEVHNVMKDQEEQPLTVGWTGTFTNLNQLEKIVPVLKKLQQDYDFKILFISNRNPHFAGLTYEYKTWELNSEISDLLRLNIGLMPLHNSDIELGKCGFKAIQYMSLGIPAVVSPVGANMQVVSNNDNGFWADTNEEWYDKIATLLNDEKKRIAFGIKARDHIILHYSVNATSDSFFNLFKA